MVKPFLSAFDDEMKCKTVNGFLLRRKNQDITAFSLVEGCFLYIAAESIFYTKRKSNTFTITSAS